jgi:hypothetical protein
MRTGCCRPTTIHTCIVYTEACTSNSIEGFTSHTPLNPQYPRAHRVAAPSHHIPTDKASLRPPDCTMIVVMSAFQIHHLCTQVPQPPCNLQAQSLLQFTKAALRVVCGWTDIIAALTSHMVNIQCHLGVVALLRRCDRPAVGEVLPRHAVHFAAGGQVYRSLCALLWSFGEDAAEAEQRLQQKPWCIRQVVPAQIVVDAMSVPLQSYMAV